MAFLSGCAVALAVVVALRPMLAYIAHRAYGIQRVPGGNTVAAEFFKGIAAR
jgi:hypothetical protein